MIRWILFTSLCWSLAAQAEVYKWVDKDGNVHFTDQKPEEDKNAETIDTSASELSEGRQQAADNRDQLLRESASATQAARAEFEELRAEQREKNREEEEKQVATCTGARQDLATFNRSNRVATIDESGKRTYLDDDQRVSRTQALRKLIAENCG